MPDSPRLTPHVLHQIALALNGRELGAIENLASILHEEPATVAAWCAGAKPIPHGILSYILSAMGGTEASDPTWRRDEWALAIGPPHGSAHHRRYLFHLWPPRFRCRAVDVYIDTAAPFETEEPVDIEAGVTYPDNHPFLLAEFERIDRPPRPDRLIHLLNAAVDAFQQLTSKDNAWEEQDTAEVHRNFRAFQQLLPTILPTKRGKIALMRDRQILDYFNTRLQARKTAQTRFPDHIWSIQEVTEESLP